MKKTVFLIAISGFLLITGCSEKDLIKDVSGTWAVQKYLYNGADRTTTFKATKKDFQWSFTSDKKYTEQWKVYDSVNNYDYEVKYSGKWVLTNSNKFLQLTRTDSSIYEYRIDEHTAKSLKLFKGNETFWLEPK